MEPKPLLDREQEADYRFRNGRLPKTEMSPGAQWGRQHLHRSRGHPETESRRRTDDALLRPVWERGSGDRPIPPLKPKLTLPKTDAARNSACEHELSLPMRIRSGEAPCAIRSHRIRASVSAPTVIRRFRPQPNRSDARSIPENPRLAAVPLRTNVTADSRPRQKFSEMSR